MQCVTYQIYTDRHGTVDGQSGSMRQRHATDICVYLSLRAAISACIKLRCTAHHHVPQWGF